MGRGVAFMIRTFQAGATLSCEHGASGVSCHAQLGARGRGMSSFQSTYRGIVCPQTQTASERWTPRQMNPEITSNEPHFSGSRWILLPFWMTEAHLQQKSDLIPSDAFFGPALSRFRRRHARA